MAVATKKRVWSGRPGVIESMLAFTARRVAIGRVVARRVRRTFESADKLLTVTSIVAACVCLVTAAALLVLIGPSPPTIVVLIQGALCGSIPAIRRATGSTRIAGLATAIPLTWSLAVCSWYLGGVGGVPPTWLVAFPLVAAVLFDRVVFYATTVSSVVAVVALVAFEELRSEHVASLPHEAIVVMTAVGLILGCVFVSVFSGFTLIVRERAIEALGHALDRANDREAQLGGLLQAIPETVIQIGGYGAIRAVSRGEAAAYVGGADELVGRPARRALPAALARVIERAHTGLSPDAPVTSVELCINEDADDGDRAYVEVRVALTVDEGALVTVRDITARRGTARKIERLHAQLAETSRRAGAAELAADLMHTVGNGLSEAKVAAGVAIERLRALPLAKLERVAGLFEVDLSVATRREVAARYVRELAEALSGQLATIEDDVARIDRAVRHVTQVACQPLHESGRVEVAIPTRLDEVLREAVMANVELPSFDLVDVVPMIESRGPVLVDRYALRMIVENLVQNAITATTAANPHAPGRVKVEAVESHDWLTVTVIDRGAGFDADRAPEMFAPRASRTSRRWGLHECSNAAKELGGSLEMHNNEHGGGATFTLRLPAKAIEEAA